ncbi:MAG: hypothetical protein PHP65_00635 [Bacilli bacterium]|nr:hypothetical protein [Bacilli bacterium]
MKETDIKEAITNYKENPELFIEDFLGRDLSIKQRYFVQRTKDKKHILAIWSRQSGKSTVIASYIVYRLLFGEGTIINGEHMPEHIAVVAPIKDQVINLYEKIQTLINKTDIISDFLIKNSIIKIKARNGNEIKFFSASPGSQIRGYTATCIVIDESQDIGDAKYMGDILPFGATTNALIIEAGTPRTKNHFYNSMNNSDVELILQPWFECPFLSEEYVMSQKKNSIESLWRAEFLCVFAEEGVVAFPSYLFEPDTKTGEWNLGDYPYITDIQQIDDEIRLIVLNQLKENAEFKIGLDLGKQNDNTVLSIFRVDLKPIKLVAQIVFKLGTPYKDIAKACAYAYRIYQPSEFNFDYTNEKTFAEELIEQGINIINDGKNKTGAIAFSSKLKIQMVMNTRLLLEKHLLQLPKSAELLISQFLNQQYEIAENDNQTYKFYHPSNEHDDALWSTLLALKNVKLSEFDGKIATTQNPWRKHDEKVKNQIIEKEETPIHDVLLAHKKLKPIRRIFNSEIMRGGKVSLSSQVKRYL